MSNYEWERGFQCLALLTIVRSEIPEKNYGY